VGKRASEQQSEAKQAKAKLMYNTKCYHAWRGYHRGSAKRTW